MWLCYQLGAREHYAIPRALHLSGLLSELFTDLWIRPDTFVYPWQKRLTGRFHPDLEKAQVSTPNLRLLPFEVRARAAGNKGWRLIMRRNQWFQRQALAQLSRTDKNENPIVFAYSYAAERIFKFARARGWRTVLGQIDPGPVEERIVSQLYKEPNVQWEAAPREYWERWRTECELADRIVVNSSWSRKALLAEGVPCEKVDVLPLAYEPAPASTLFERKYPQAFNSMRPLRVLFLGQINLRKGVRHLLEAVELLKGENVEFWFVGPKEISLPQHSAIKWFGVATRLDVHKYYQDADAFILPTLSDGFGLTQLEAQSWKLPVVASSYCGEVVRDGMNGVVLKEVSGQAIAEVLLTFLRSPETLSAMSARSGVSECFSLKRLACSLRTLNGVHPNGIRTELAT